MTAFFYLFAGLIVLSSVCVVSTRNPVISVLWLIFAFCNASGLMILLGAEFLAMMLIVIYVGAVAVLFLFVVMMLDISFTEIQGELRKNLSIASIVAVIMFVDLVLVILLATKTFDIEYPESTSAIDNTLAIAKLLYTDFVLPFQTSGLILFVAMISCIVLTIQTRPTLSAKHQNVQKQLSRDKDNSIFITKVGTNSGIEGLKYD